MIDIDYRDWYWVIGDDDTQVFSSARAAMVPADDAAYAAWREAGGIAAKVNVFADAIGVLRAANIPPYHVVPKRLMVDRLQAVGKLEAARAALDAAPLYVQERWNTRMVVNGDDPTARALIAAIGADPDAILAPE